MDAPYKTPPTRDRVPVTEHINYLSDAAHLLRAAAPETSAWLMSRSNELSLNEGLQPTDAQRQRACGACGHIMIPGMGSSIRIEAERVSRKRQRKAEGKTKAGGLRKVLQCGHCTETTTIKLEPAPSASKMRRQLRPKARKGQESGSQPSTRAVGGASSSASAPGLAFHPKAGSTGASTATSAANASSKKRAKNRKAGLQALLDQSKSAQGRSLSLADFSMR